MTTREFKRRLLFYAAYDHAAKFFLVPTIDFVYRVTLDWSCSHRIETCFVPSISSDLPFNSVFLDDCNSLYYDKFSREDFLIQYKYFHSFFDRCSQLQKVSLIQSGLCSNLCIYIGDEAKLV